MILRNHNAEYFERIFSPTLTLSAFAPYFFLGSFGYSYRRAVIIFIFKSYDYAHFCINAITPIDPIALISALSSPILLSNGFCRCSVYLSQGFKKTLNGDKDSSFVGQKQYRAGKNMRPSRLLSRQLTHRYRIALCVIAPRARDSSGCQWLRSAGF